MAAAGRSDSTKRSLSCERGESAAQSGPSTGRAAGRWTRGGTGRPGCAVRRGSTLGSRAAPVPARATAGLSSSRSSPSLHLSSLSADPSLRTCCSLSRLDQRATGVGAERACEDLVRISPTLEKAALESRQLPSSGAPEEIPRAEASDKYGADHGEQIDAEESDSKEPPSTSSSVVTNTLCSIHHNRLKKQPDLMNFKKGWMMRLDTDGQWKKHWFVLTDQILRFYRDSVAEEAADVDGEINLSTCYDITDYPSQKNYGFQIHTKDGLYTLCAMTSGTRRNWVQAVLKHVRPTLTPDGTSSTPEQKMPLESQRPECDSSEAVEEAQKNEKALQDPAIIRPTEQEVSAPSSAAEIFPLETVESDISTPTPLPASEQGGGECVNMRVEIEQKWQQVETNPPKEEKQVSIGNTCDYMNEKERLYCERQTAQLVKELEKTQRELSRLQQFNRSLQDQLQQERDNHSREGHLIQNGLLQTSTPSSAQATAVQRLQKMNQDLRFELEAQRRIQQEAREAELRRRAHLLAQQAHLLVTGDTASLTRVELEQNRQYIQEQQEEWERHVAALQTQVSISEAQRRESDSRMLQLQQASQDCQALNRNAELEQDLRHFQEQRAEWEQQVASLQSRLSISEEQRRESAARILQLQQESEGYQSLQKTADCLRENLRDVSARLRANEEAQVQKELRLQKHLVLLQESQDRERRSLAASLTQAEQHSQELKEQLERAEQQLESMTKSQSLTKEVEEAQQQLQEELTCTLAAVQKLKEEREHLSCHCQELQNQLAEADGEVTRLQNRLKTEETDYYNLEHSYERVCEELQLVLGQAQGREAEVQDVREGYERLLDMKEQELSEVLLKMEVLGNSLEETEVKLSEVLKGCTCASPNQDNETLDSVQHDQRHEQTSEPLVKVNDNGVQVKCSSHHNLNETDAMIQFNVNNSSSENGRTRSRSADPSYQYVVSAGDDPEKFMSVIQVLETKLFVTEEKLRDITQKLQEPQVQSTCPDAHIYSQLTQSRANEQHLTLLLHSQAQQNKRFVRETENSSRLLVHWFQAAQTSIAVCRERLCVLLNKLEESNTSINSTELENQLATAASCVQQGQKDAEKQHLECRYACKGVDDTKNEKTSETETRASACDMSTSEDEGKSIGTALKRELWVVQKMLSVLQNTDYISQIHSASRERDGDVVQRYKDIVSQRIALETDKGIQQGKADRDYSESLESAICRICIEAELIYTALKVQRQYNQIILEDLPVDDQGMEHLWQDPGKCSDLADIIPPELAPYEEQVQLEGRGLDEEGKHLVSTKSLNKTQEQTWLERLVCQLQQRAQVIHQISQEITGCIRQGEKDVVDCHSENISAKELMWMQDQAKLIYVADRLFLDFKLALQQYKTARDRLQVLYQEQDITLKNEQRAFNHTLSQLQEDNRALREQLECTEQKRMVTETGNQHLLQDIQEIEHYHEERMQKLEREFKDKIKELQQIHEEEMKHLHHYYAKSGCISTESQSKSCLETNTNTSSPEPANSAVLNELKVDGPAIHDKLLSMEGEGQRSEPEANLNPVIEYLKNGLLEGEAVVMREAYKRDLEKLKASCEQGFTAMEEVQRKLVSDLQQQHQKEVAALLKEKDQLLKEETAATLAAIEAMRRAHKQELESSHSSQSSGAGSDVTQLHTKEELRLLRKELEVLSIQHTRKCLENSQMGQELEAGRQALLQCQQENQELKNKQEVSQRLTEEIYHARTSSSLSGEQSDTTSQARSLCEMEVILRVQDAELQCVRQEALSLKEELKIALKDKNCIMKELDYLSPDHTIHGEKARCDVSNFWEDVKPVAQSSRDDDRDGSSVDQGHEDAVLTKSDFLKRTERTSLTRQIRGARSKSLKEGLSVQERMKLFESF